MIDILGYLSNWYKIISSPSHLYEWKEIKQFWLLSTNWPTPVETDIILTKTYQILTFVWSGAVVKIFDTQNFLILLETIWNFCSSMSHFNDLMLDFVSIIWAQQYSHPFGEWLHIAHALLLMVCTVSTRMHSSRMRTVPCSSRLLGYVVSVRGNGVFASGLRGVCLWSGEEGGVPTQGAVCLPPVKGWWGCLPLIGGGECLLWSGKGVSVSGRGGGGICLWSGGVVCLWSRAVFARHPLPCEQNDRQV